MFNIYDQIFLSILLSICLSSFTWEVIKRFKIVLKGEGSLPFDNIPLRLKRVFDEFFLQKKVLQQRFIPGLMHAFVFWGLLIINWIFGIFVFLLTKYLINIEKRKVKII